MWSCTRIDFGRPRQGLRSGGIDDEIHAFLAEIQRRGMIDGNWIVDRDSDGWFAICRTDRRVAGELPAATERIGRALAALAPWFDRAPHWRSLGVGQGPRAIRWQRCARLLLWSSFLDHEAPVRDFDSGRPVRLLSLPVAEDLRNGLLAWARTFAQCDDLWFGSGVLEKAAWRQLAAPRSLLQRQARDLAAAVEAATGLPTFRYLVRDLGRVERHRLCPSCGRRWLRRAHGGWSFTLRCEPCRLVSHGSSAC